MLLVTGITGHSGRYFLQELVNNKHLGAIRCVVRETSNTAAIDNSGLNIEKVVGNLDDQNFINSVMSGVDTVMHIYNIHHSPKIVQAAMDREVERVILVHTTGIYSNHKRASEGYKQVEGEIFAMISDPRCKTNITILRPTMIFGDLCDKNISRFIRLIDRLRVFPVINGGKSLVQPVNAKDLGKAYYQVLVFPKVTAGKIYDLSGEKPVKLIDILKLISKELGKKTIYFNIPMQMALFMAKLLKLITIGNRDYIEKVLRMGENRSYSHDNAAFDFGYRPSSFELGIRAEVQQHLRKSRGIIKEGSI